MKRKGLDRTKKMQSSCTFFKFHHILYLITMMHEIKYFIPYIDQTKIEKYLIYIHEIKYLISYY